MLFKIKNTEISVGYGFTFAVFLILVFSSSNKTPLLFFAASLLHEAGHFAAMAFYGCKVKKIKLTFCGAEIVQKEQLNSFTQDAFIRLSGPLANFLVHIVCSLICKTNAFSRINIVLCVFNLLPVYSLDGGGVVKSILSVYCDPEKVKQILTIVSYITVIPLSLWGALLILNGGRNYSVFAAGVYLFALLLKEK